MPARIIAAIRRIFPPLDLIPPTGSFGLQRIVHFVSRKGVWHVPSVGPRKRLHMVVRAPPSCGYRILVCCRWQARRPVSMGTS
jgi:hypothetical protein